MKKLKSLLNSTKGFTFIEIMATVIILAVIFGPILYLFYQPNVDKEINMRKIEALSRANTALKLVIDGLRGVQSEEVTVSGEKLPGIELQNTDLIVLRSPSSQIAYSYNTAGETGRILKYIDGQNGQSITRNVDSTTGAVTLTVAGPEDVIASNVEEFKVTAFLETFNAGASNEYKKATSYTVEVKIKPKNVGQRVVEAVTAKDIFSPRFIEELR